MSAKRVEDGGPAFPVEVSSDSEGWLVGRQTGSQSGFATGISIRDYFAAQAMSEFIRDLLTNEKLVHDRIPMDVVAERSYSVADAMLKARTA